MIRVRPAAWCVVLVTLIVSALPLVTIAPVGVATSAAAPGAPVTGAEPQRVRVATKPLTPFVIFTDTDAGLEGFSIDLWAEVAARNGWETEWVQTETVDEVLTAVDSGSVDLAIAGISVNAEREQIFDFSQPMFDSGLQILVRSEGDRGLWPQIRGLLSGSVLKFLGGMLIVLIVSGHLVWLVQRRDGRAPGSYLAGVSHGMWVSGVTALAGDVETPRRWVGRLVAMAWILVGVVGVALFTATVTSQLTVDSISSDITGLKDLPGKEVVTVAGSTSDTYLTRLGLAHTTVDTIDLAYPQLGNGSVDAIVYDAPVLQHRANTLGKGRELVVGPIFSNEAYGIAFPNESPLLEKTNRSLLELRADGTYDRLYTRWFGDK
ncbi:MAG: transporter substrate-binding domain-containing protein [Nocardioides sp.]